MPGVESGLVRQRVRSIERCPDLARHAGYDSAVGIDRGSDPGIGVSQQPASILDCPHASLLEVLCVGAAVTIPSVVGNVHENLRAVGGGLPDLIRKDGLVTDEYT